MTTPNPVPGPIKPSTTHWVESPRKGAMAVVAVEGEDDPEIFDPDQTCDTGRWFRRVQEGPFVAASHRGWGRLLT